jgi:hypothetical protein
MDSQYLYVVTIYGLDGSGQMYLPENRLFINYDDAYAFFLKEAPRLDNDIITEQCTADEFMPTIKGSTIIECREQSVGFHMSTTGHYAKRPKGVVITKCLIY